MLLANNYRPRNESIEHYELKQIAKYILKNKGYNIIGEEIEIGIGKYLNTYKQFNNKKLYKSRIDVVGLNLKGTFYSCIPYRKEDTIKNGEVVYKEPLFKSIGIEAKVSLSDFKNGFSTKCERTYIIAPKGIIPIDLIPDKIGLIEVDLNNYSIKNEYHKFIFEGIVETIKPKINLDPRFKLRDKPKDNKEYQHFCKDILRFIAYRYSIDDLYKKNEIVIG